MHIRTAGAAGKLSIGFGDHWIPNANDTTTKQTNDWADKNKVEVTIDFITSNDFKIQVTQAAEAQPGAGHAMLPFYNWEVQTYAEKLEPMDDVIAAMAGQYGNTDHPLIPGEDERKLAGIPSSTGTLNLTCCGRISLLKQLAGIDVLEMYPAHKSDPKAAAVGPTIRSSRRPKPVKGGLSVRLGLGQTVDSVNNPAHLFRVWRVELVNAKGDTIRQGNNIIIF